MTIAQQIAAKFDNDGQVLWIDEGEAGVDIIQVSLDDVCKRYGPEIDQNWEREATRYTFSDGSVITAAGDAWDYGFVDCFCWHECGHDESRCESNFEDSPSD